MSLVWLPQSLGNTHNQVSASSRRCVAPEEDFRAEAEAVLVGRRVCEDIKLSSRSGGEAGPTLAPSLTVLYHTVLSNQPAHWPSPPESATGNRPAAAGSSPPAQTNKCVCLLVGWLVVAFIVA